jgi:amidase
MLDFWNSTSSRASSGLPLDGLICPVHPSASFPHDAAVWWGYTAPFNMLDYPKTILPMEDFSMLAEKDPKNEDYQSLDH